MKNLIGAVGVAFFAVAGGIGGQMLKSDGTGAADHMAEADGAGHDEDMGDHGKKDDHGDGHVKKKKDDGHGGRHAEASSSEIQYFDFSREFIVPIMRDQRVESLVIININLEVQSSVMDKLFSVKPKLRDSIMTTLVGLSNDGTTLVDPTNVDSYETIRSVILLNLSSVVASGIENVLIMDLAKQDL